jgi:hypothetical protein
MQQLTAPPKQSTISNEDEIDYPKLLKEQQEEFETYRREKAANETMLKELLDKAQQENAQLNRSLAKSELTVQCTQGRFINNLISNFFIF